MQSCKIGGTFARTGLPPALSSAVYDAANRLTQWGATTLTYDNNGNLTNDGTNTYNWNARNQLASISGGATASFVYDGLARREKKTINSTLTEFLFDGVNPVQETSGAPVTANILTGLGIDEYFTRSIPADPTATRHFLGDALGSTVALTNDAGAVQTEYTYEPFGRTTVTGETSTNPYQFTGRENDGTGLYYYRARYYHPVFQRFISEDPIEFEGGDINLYTYVWNDPLGYVDPEGLGGIILIGARTGLIPRQLFPSQRGGPPAGGNPRPSPNPQPRYDPRYVDPRQPRVPGAPEGPHNPLP